MIGPHLKVILLFAGVKGATVGAVTQALDVPFLKSLVIAAVSGSIGAAGAIVAAVIAVRETRKVKREIGDVKAVVGADKRATDKPAGDQRQMRT